jgi:benzoyl-CoA reductase/2-hydroxyglutaryl-CoA dehydratase subunit BcrC/BadD/HgdB
MKGEEVVKTESETVFDEILENIENGLVREAMGEGRIPIGYTCSQVPEPLLSVGNLFPLRLRAPGIAGTELADIYLPPIICTYCRSLLEYGMDGHYDFIGGWVFSFSCQHMNRCYDNVRHAVKPSFVHVLDTLHTLTESTTSWMADELKILAGRLSSHFDVEIDKDSLSKAIAEHNRFASLLREIGDLRKLDNPPLTGTEFHKLMISSQAAPKDLLQKEVERFREEIAKRDGMKDYRARLMVLGGVLDDPGYVGIIEETGGLVVADHFCTGSFSMLEMIPERAEDPFVRLARHSLSRPCPRMIDRFDIRLNTILESAKAYGVDGVIIQQLKFCDPMNAYGKVMMDCLQEAGLRVLRLDREYRLSGEGQLRTRVQAFIESLGK